MRLQQILIMIFFALFAYVGLTDHKPASLALIPDPLDAGGYPTIASILLLISLGLTVFEDLRLAARGRVTAYPPISRNVLLMVLMLILYVAAFELIGFYVSTFTFCVISLFVIFGEEKPRMKSVMFYGLGTLAFWVVILKGFNLYLPSGLLF